MAHFKIVVRDPGILSGEPVFRGTRVPFKSLTDYLEHGRTLDEFLEVLPGSEPRSRDRRTRRSQIQPECGSEMRLLLDECVPRKLKFMFVTVGT